MLMQPTLKTEPLLTCSSEFSKALADSTLANSLQSDVQKTLNRVAQSISYLNIFPQAQQSLVKKEPSMTIHCLNQLGKVLSPKGNDTDLMETIESRSPSPTG